MKILYIHRTQGVGAEGAHIMGMYQAFQELGHKLKMLCPQGCDPTLNQKAAENTSEQKPNLIKKIYWAISEFSPQFIFEIIELGYNLVIFFKLLKLILIHKPQLIYERYSLNTFSAVFLSKVLDIPHVLEINDSVTIERSRPLSFNSISKIIEKYCSKKTDLIITITDDFKSRLVGAFPIPTEKILVLPNAVNFSHFEIDNDTSSLREKYSTKGKVVIGGSGQFLPWHGLKEILNYLGPDQKRYSLKFLFIGDGPVRLDIESLAKQLNIRESVEFTGMVSITEVPKHLQLLNIAVIPQAAIHASPMKLMEYMASGLPIVAPDLPSITAVLEHNKTGLIFPKNDFQQMKELVISLLENPDLANTIGQNARTYIRENLTWKSHGNTVLKKLKLI